MSTHPKVRYAVIGAGHIAQSAVLPAFAHAKENSELIAVVSGDVAKRVELSKKYGLLYAADYSHLEALLTEASIDAVYIATPNSNHVDLALRAAKAGVHVLCEKPLAESTADAQVMADTCEHFGVKLMVAYRLHFDEATLSGFELLANGKIGEPRIFESTFTHVVRPGDIRVQRETGGGATLDLGVYCVNTARHVFQAEPIQVFATSVFRDGSDETTTVTLRFAGDRVAHFTVSNAASAVSNFRVIGTGGDFLAQPAFGYGDVQNHYISVEGKTEHVSYKSSDQFAPELIHFSDCILRNKKPKTSADEAIADLRVIDAIFESATTGKLVVLEPRRHAYHPKVEQKLFKPPVSREKTINAPGPTLS
jgi:predicted dehydrogenase